MPTPGIELASVSDALAALDHATGALRAAEIGQILAIAALCDLHRVDETVLVEGCERWVPGGAEGTPSIGEFIAAEIGVMLGVSSASAMGRIARVLNVRHRHPVLWASVLGGGVRFYEADRVAEACVAAGLSAEACWWLDRQCAIALLTQPWARVRGKIDGWILMADPALAAERAARAATARNVGVGRIVDGHCDVWGRVDAADGIAFDQALNAIADTLADGHPEASGAEGDALHAQVSRDHRRAAAVGVLARQALGQPELPRVAEIVVRIDATIHDSDAGTADGGASAALNRACIPGVGTVSGPAGLSVHRADGSTGPVAVGQPHPSGTGVLNGASFTPEGMIRGGQLVLSPVAEVQGWGAVLTSRLRGLLDGCRVTVRPVVDARRLVPVPGYEVSDRVRLAVTERWPVDAFPYGTLRSTVCDLDHSTPYAEGGRTEVGNLAPLKRFVHRVRTHGGWRVEQSDPGRLTWTSPHGYTYAVTPAGTLRIGRPPPREHDWWNREPPDWLET